MDDFLSTIQSASGAQPPKTAAFDPNASYGTPSQLLDNLKQTESSGNSYAINKDTKAMGPYQFMPETVAMLHQSGVKFDPFDPQQSRNAADYYIQQLASKNGGDLNKAMAAYGGFVTKDPSGYVGKVMKGVNTTSVAPQPSSPDDFNVADLLATANKADLPTKPQAATPANQSIKSVIPTDLGKKMDATVNDITGAVGNTIYKTGTGILSGWRGLATLATGGSIDDAVNAMHDDQQYRESAVPQLTKNGKMAEKIINLPGAVVGKVASFAGDKTLDVTGSPALATAMETGINALPLVFLKKGGNKPISLTGADSGISRALAPKAETPTPTPVSSTNYDIPTYIRNKMPAEPVPVPRETVQTSPPLPEVPEPTAYSSGVINDQSAISSRAKTLNAIGLENARNSALQGDAASAATEYQMGKFNEPAGAAAKDQFNAERAALESHAEKIVNDTGGTLGMDQESRLARGNTILKPLDDLKNWFDQNTSKLYQEADARANGVPTNLDSFKATLADDSELTNSDRVHLRDGLNSYVKKLGIAQEDGSLAGTAKQAETVRKYLNENWSPANSRFVGKLKDALDDDVTKSAGEDIYKQARAMRAMRAVTLDDPNGISKIMDSSGPDGINRKVPAEQVASNITSMPDAQFQHVLKTLQNVPTELQAQAQAAIAEIKAHFANQILDSGANMPNGKVREMWGHAGVDRVLSNNASKINSIFTPEEIANIYHLRNAGHILSVDSSYPGAAAQAANSLKRGLMSTAIQRAATLAGGATGGVFGAPGTGAIAGEYLGSKAASRFGEGAALKKFQKGVTKLSDVAPSP